VIIFGSIRILSKKNNQTGFLKKNPKPVQTGLFRFGYFRTKIDFFNLAWFFSGLAWVFSGLARFLPAWLWVFSIWVRFSFFKILIGLIGFFSWFGFFGYFFPVFSV